MKTEKGNTIQYIKERRKASQQSRDALKEYNARKKAIITALKESEKSTIPEIAKKLDMPSHEVVYYLMSLLKYGLVEALGLDDMDEYYYYKLKDNGKD